MQKEFIQLFDDYVALFSEIDTELIKGEGIKPVFEVKSMEGRGVKILPRK